MRHLKLFEGYLDQYYQKMGDDFAYNDIEDSVEDMDNPNRIISKLKKGVKIYSSIGSLTGVTRLTLEEVFEVPRGKECHVYIIFKCRDDYYYVKNIVRIEKVVRPSMPTETRYISDDCDWYRCDQWEGLMKLLSDKLLIKK